jgi:hypothetical protein
MKRNELAGSACPRLKVRQDLLSKPILSGFQALDCAEADLTVDVFGQIEVKGTLDDGLVIEDISELLSALP